MPVARVAPTKQETSSTVCKCAAFYRKYKIEFHMSGMVFCLIGGKVRKGPPRPWLNLVEAS